MNEYWCEYTKIEPTDNGNLKTGGGLAPNSVNSIIAVLQNSLETAHILGIAEKYEMMEVNKYEH